MYNFSAHANDGKEIVKVVDEWVTLEQANREKSIQLYILDWFTKENESSIIQHADEEAYTIVKPKQKKDFIASFPESGSIVDVKMAIYSEMQVPYSQQIIIYHNSIYEDTSTLKEIGVQHGDTIVMTTKEVMGELFGENREKCVLAVPDMGKMKFIVHATHQTHIDVKTPVVVKSAEDAVKMNIVEGKPVSKLRTMVNANRFVRRASGTSTFNLMPREHYPYEETGKQRELRKKFAKVMHVDPKQRSSDMIKVVSDWIQTLKWAGTSNFSKNTLSDIGRNITLKRYSMGDFIFREMDEATSFYIILYGMVCITVNGVGRVAAFGPNDHFGEIALLAEKRQDRLRTANASVCYTDSCESYVDIAQIDKNTYERILFHHQRTLLAKKESSLVRFSIFKKLSSLYVSRLAYACGYDEYDALDSLLSKDRKLEGLYLVVKGKVKVTMEMPNESPYVYLAKAPVEFGLLNCLNTKLKQDAKLSLTAFSELTVLKFPAVQIANLVASFHGMQASIEKAYEKKMAMIRQRIDIAKTNASTDKPPEQLEDTAITLDENVQFSDDIHNPQYLETPFGDGSSTADAKNQRRRSRKPSISISAVPSSFGNQKVRRQSILAMTSPTRKNSQATSRNSVIANLNIEHRTSVLPNSGLPYIPLRSGAIERRRKSIVVESSSKDSHISFISIDSTLPITCSKPVEKATRTGRVIRTRRLSTFS